MKDALASLVVVVVVVVVQSLKQHILIWSNPLANYI